MDVQILQGDCLEVMREIPNGLVHAVVTDPPYGIRLPTAYRSRGRGNLAQCNDYPPIFGDDRQFDPTPWLDFPIVVLFGANYFAHKLPASSRWLVWDKRDGMNSNDQADIEMAWTNVKGPSRLFHHRWNGMIKASERRERRVHPTQKPVALMEWVMEQARVPHGATVLDPFMGSGSTGVACLRTGRRFIGIEINPGYIEITKRRLGLEQVA